MAPAAPGWRALRDAVGLPDVRIVSAEPPDEGWPDGGLELCRAGRSTRSTEIVWDAGKLTITIRALASPDDCDLALRVAEGAARLAGAATVEADYFGAVDLAELRRLHTADWMREQAVSGARALATLIREGRGPLAMPGPQRSCWVGARLLAELEAAGPAEAFADRVLETMRRVQWDIPAGFRDAGVFVSGGRGNGDGPGRETRFAVWLADENLVIPCVDYVALRVAEGEIVMVPFGAVAGLAGTHGTLLDECQLLVRAMSDDDWADLVARARPLAASPPGSRASVGDRQREAEEHAARVDRAEVERGELRLIAGRRVRGEQQVVAAGPGIAALQGDPGGDRIRGGERRAAAPALMSADSTPKRPPASRRWAPRRRSASRPFRASRARSGRIRTRVPTADSAPPR